MLFYGPSGAGKKTRITCVLRQLFGAGVEKVRALPALAGFASNGAISVKNRSTSVLVSIETQAGN